MNIDNVYKIPKKEVVNYNDLIEIQTEDPFKVLIATILSARTKDETTAEVCKRLFAKINIPEDLEKFSEKEIQDLIYPVGFYQNKAKYLKQLPDALKQFNGVPNNIDDLVTLPGVGRKTANLVVAIAFKKPAICVDIHVHRIMNRLGYVETKTPYETEMELRKKLPESYWITFNSIFVAFGQNLCRPISPHCSKCPIEHECPRIGVETTR